MVYGLRCVKARRLFLIKKGREDYILTLLKQLCKEIQKELKPIADDIAEVVNDASKIKRDYKM